MNFRLSFNIESLKIEAYAVNVRNGIPSKFQIFVNGSFEGFIYYGTDKWEVQLMEISSKRLTDDLAQKIGDYLILLYE